MRGVPWIGRAKQSFRIRCPGWLNAFLNVTEEELSAFVGANDPALVGEVHPMNRQCGLDGFATGP